MEHDQNPSRYRISESPQTGPYIDLAREGTPNSPPLLSPQVALAPLPNTLSSPPMPFAFPLQAAPPNANTPPSPNTSPPPSPQMPHSDRSSLSSPEDAQLLLSFALEGPPAPAEEGPPPEHRSGLGGDDSKRDFAVIINRRPARAANGDANGASSSSSLAVPLRTRRSTEDLTPSEDDSEPSGPLTRRVLVVPNYAEHSQESSTEEPLAARAEYSSTKLGKRRASDEEDFEPARPSVKKTRRPSKAENAPRASDGPSSSRRHNPLQPIFREWNGQLWSLQLTRCLASRFEPCKRQVCHQCVGRVSGYTCVFQNLRWWAVDSKESNKPITNIRPILLSSTEPDEEPIFPDGYNESLTPEHAIKLKTAAATYLLPTMEEELAHASRSDTVRIRLEPKVRTTCDSCLHSILGGFWMCNRCAREMCFTCFGIFEGQKANKTPSYQDKRLLHCYQEAHAPEHFVPLTRFMKEELETTVSEMKEWGADHALEQPPPLSEAQLEEFYVAPDPRYASASNEESHPVLRISGQGLRRPVVPVRSAPLQVADGDLQYNDDSIESDSQTRFGSFTPRLFGDNSELFESIWSRGMPIVVNIDDGESIKLDWTPEYFIREYGHHPCAVVNNRSGNSVQANVGLFFLGFGQARDPGISLKIKDWPSTTDFKSEFPPLYEDFMQALPVGSVTRRDGVLNVAAHTPLNANPPDLGPKGYFSQTSDDTPGGTGSTKLHTVNLMLWSSSLPDGSPGMAAWDIFRAEDTVLIRDFLYELMAKRSGRTAAQAREAFDDPIHGQNFYLDEDLRKQLREEKYVKSFRIWQRPGECVFIPAGCAHQVCNFADCIKIASDFVSIENVARCWKVTDEFREQTKEKALWRTDVLQLKSQLLWAWRACNRLDAA